jgi:hypothetical protein
MSDVGSGEKLPSFIKEERDPLREPQILKSPPVSSNEEKAPYKNIHQLREEYERVKEQAHQILSHQGFPAADTTTKINESKLLLNLSIPSGVLDLQKNGKLLRPEVVLSHHRRDAASAVILPNALSGQSLKHRPSSSEFSPKRKYS